MYNYTYYGKKKNWNREEEKITFQKNSKETGDKKRNVGKESYKKMTKNQIYIYYQREIKLFNYLSSFFISFKI